MLSRSSASASLVDILASSGCNSQPSGSDALQGPDQATATATNVAGAIAAASHSPATHDAGGEGIQHPARPGFNRQLSSSSAKSITQRLQQQSVSSGSSTTSSASSGKTVGQQVATAMRPASTGSGSTVGSVGAGPPEISPRSSIALQLATAGATPASMTAPHAQQHHQHRISTRPVNRRAASYNNGASTASLPLASSSAAAGSGSRPPHSSTGPPSPTYGSNASTTSLPMTTLATAPLPMMHHVQRPHSSLRTEWSDADLLPRPGSQSPPAATSIAMAIPGLHASQCRRGSRDSSTSRRSMGAYSDDADRSAPSSLKSHSPYFQPFPHHEHSTNAVASTSHSPPSAQYQYSAYAPPRSPHAPPSPIRASSSPPRARDFALLSSTNATSHISPLTAGNIRAKGKEVATGVGTARSRQTSASSRFGLSEANGDVSVDETTTDLASDAGTNAWDVRETDKLRSSKDANGRKMINQYARVAEIGKGVHGKVWLCEDTETGQAFAVKCVNRESRAKMKNLRRSQAEAAEARRRQQSQDQIDDPAAGRWSTDRDERDPDASFDEEMQLNQSADSHLALARRQSSRKRPIVMDEKVKQEIAIMKRCRHEHVVQLREVIDDRRSKKVFMVLEYMPGGQIEWTKDDEPLMTVDESRRVFRDVVLGLEYLHHQGIIHRDIKPANLLWTQDRQTVKISDFGVSHLSAALQRTSAAGTPGSGGGASDDSALRKTEGSPAFFAPELCAGMESTPIGTPINELERTSSRPDYFRRTSAMSSGSGGSAERQPPTSIHQRTWTAMTGATEVPKRPSVPDRSSTQTITTISHPLSAQQQQKAHRARGTPSRPVIGKGIDVWALGVTLYCLLYGYPPFREATSEYELYNMIPKKEIVIPPYMGSDRLKTGSGVPKELVEHDSAYTEGREAVDLLSRLLEKDPMKRIELHEVKRHPWVLRNLDNSQNWLKDHDLAQTGVVSVTKEEVEHATAERTEPQIPTGLKGRFKRFGEMFGWTGQPFLRKSISRRDRSKSVSSTSASVTTASASAWDGRSEPSASRAASRQASIVKKKSNVRTADDFPVPAQEEVVDQNALLSHASMLKRKLANAKAAREAHETALSVSTTSPTERLDVHNRDRGGVPHDQLSRSLSSSDSGAGSREGSSSAHAQTFGSQLLQAPAMIKRRVSLGTDYFTHPNASAPQVQQSKSSSSESRPASARPSLSSGSSRPVSQISGPGTDTEGEKLVTGRISGFWQKLRSGSRTPAARQSQSAATTPGTARGPSAGLQPLAMSTTSKPDLLHSTTRETQPDNSAGQSPGSTRRASIEFPIFSPISSASRPSSQDTEPDARPPLAVADIDAKLTAARLASSPSNQGLTAPDRFGTSAPSSPFNMSLPETALSDSSDSSLSDDDSDIEDYGEAISPSAYGTTDAFSAGSSPPQPLMWSDNATGWHTNNANLDSALATAHASYGTPIRPQSSARYVAPLRLEQSQTQSMSSRRPSAAGLKVPLPSPSRFTSPVRTAVAGETGHAADDENDEEEEEEVMIKPRSRIRRGTNASQGGSAPASIPNTARPSMPASPRISYQGAILKPV